MSFLTSIRAILNAFPKRKAQSTQAPAITDPFESLWQEVDHLLVESHQEDLRNAHAAAAAGTGPQQWDRDWIEYNFDFHDEASYLASNWNWHSTWDLIEALDWALASPQGQRAQSMQDDQSSPWKSTLNLILAMRPALVKHAHNLMRSQAEGLHYSTEKKAELSYALNSLLHLEEQEA
jgi:hypothetical protein